MGRRELFLIVAFLILGVVVFQVTVPKSTSTSSVGLGDVFKRWQREVSGSKATAVADRTFTATATTATRRVRIEGFSGRLIVSGADGDETTARLKLQVGGTDQADATAAVPGLITEWRVDETELVVSVRHPDEWRVQVRRVPGELTITMPRRLSIHLDVDGGMTEVSDVAGVTLDAGRTNVTLARIAGKVDGEMSDGSLDIRGAASASVQTRRTTVTADGIHADARFESTDGQLELRNVAGNVELEVRRLRARLTQPGGSVRAEASDVTLEIDDLRGALDVDGARTRVTAHVVALAAMSIDTSDGAVVVTLPAGAVAIDAENEVGPIELPEPAPAGQRDGLIERRKARYGDGGPELVLRNKRGPITVTRAS